MCREKEELVNLKIYQLRLSSLRDRKKKKKEKKREQSLQDLEIQEKEDKVGERIFEEIIDENFLNLMKNINLYIQGQ